MILPATLRLALYQAPPTLGDVEAALDRLADMLAAAAAAGARMLVAPELLLPGYNRPDLHGDLAQPKDGPWQQRLSALARAAGCGVTLGWAERDGDRVYNAATAIGADGEVLGHYRKIQLFGPMEHASFASGDTYALFDLEGHRTALLVCYDVEFAPHVRALAERGAELILVPSANPAGFEHVSDTFVPARAGEMNLTIAYANFCGTDGDITFAGQSLVAGPDTQTIARAGRAPALLVADLGPAPAPALRSTQLTDYRKV